MTSEKLKQIYELLLEHFGHQQWWPGESTFEIISGAILTQNTNWKNVEKALDNLRQRGLLSPEKLYEISPEQLSELIRPAGYYKVKTKRLKSFLDFLFDKYDGGLSALGQLSGSRLREELLGIKGIGPETADSIALYAFDKETFVVDTYTARIVMRHQLIEPQADYYQLKNLFESNLAGDVEMFNEFHALLVACGKKYCRVKPLCRECPLNGLPHVTDPSAA